MDDDIDENTAFYYSLAAWLFRRHSEVILLPQLLPQSRVAQLDAALARPNFRCSKEAIGEANRVLFLAESDDSASFPADITRNKTGGFEGSVILEFAPIFRAELARLDEADAAETVGSMLEHRGFADGRERTHLGAAAPPMD